MRRRRAYLVGVGVLTGVALAGLLAAVAVLVLAAVGDQADDWAKQLEDAGYTSVSVEPDVVVTDVHYRDGKNRAAKVRKAKVVDHYQVTAGPEPAGSRSGRTGTRPTTPSRRSTAPPSIRAARET